MNMWLKISSERKQVVIKEISEGSEPEMRFYIMVAVSTMIASFGLITNSTAVIIGAMLVAPLMTPIFGIALALIRSDSHLFGRAIKAEIAGVVAAVAMGLVLGWLYPALSPTPEMLSRTEPQLFDLLVAVFSGFAGAYALMDEKISPALPGVAIATAIVPPLANTGLCFSVGQYVAGVGSFLLFFANFLSILLVASAAFWFFGMTGSFAQIDKKIILRRFSFPLVCFALVAAFLTYTLIKIAHHHYLNESIVTTLKKELLEYPDTGLDSFKYDQEKDVIYVLANIHSSTIMTPNQVDRLEHSLQQVIGRETKLIVRSTIATDISALNSPIKLVEQQLDGSFTQKMIHPRVRYAKAADTIIRNYVAKIVGYELDFVKYLEVGDIPTIFATMHGIAVPHPDAIKDMEERLRKELDLPNARLLLSFIESRLYDNSGSVRLEFSGLIPNYRAQDSASVTKSIEIIRKDLLSRQQMTIMGVNYNMFDDVLYVLVDAQSPHMISVETVQDIEKKATNAAKLPTKLFVNLKSNTVITSSGYEPYWSVARAAFQRQLTANGSVLRKLIEESNM
jgi:uncharacterized hydrophobic protein (TIGR00271 family)